MTSPAPAQPVFDPSAPHMQMPRLRPVRGFRAQAGDQEALGLADARQVSDRVVFVAPAAQLIFPLMDGQKTLDEIVQQVGRGLTRKDLENLVAQLDSAGLLYGPTFDAMLEKMRREFDSASILPPGPSAALADALLDAEVQSKGGTPPTDEERPARAAAALRTAMDQWIAQALKDVPNPSLDTLPGAVVAPHIDYPRGWLNYASVWGRLRVTDRPDRVVILGTNHFGEGTGVTGCDKGYASPFGVSEVDTQLIEVLRKHLGEENSAKLFANRYDHEREHSIELQVPWIHHCLGSEEGKGFCKVFGVLIHDPTVNNGESYDGKGLALAPFIDAMKATLAQLPGKTLVVASADLSHVGPAFGDPVQLAGDNEQATAMRNKVFSHDRDMIQLIMERKPDELVAAMSWQQNPTRWCSIGNLVATLKIVEPSSVVLYNFAASMDEQGTALVSNVGMAMMR
jgi:AmmeMemoRadiSam system protein B